MIMNENILKGILENFVGDINIDTTPIIFDLDKHEIRSISKDEASELLNKSEKPKENKEYMNLNEFDENIEITDDVEVIIYVPYEDKSDLFMKISDLGDVFGEDVTNKIYVNKSEKIFKIEIFNKITQNEIFDLLCIFGENVRFTTTCDSLWIVVDDCI